MTFAEKARKEHPERMNFELGYPPIDCPHHAPFDYPDTREDCHCAKYTCKQCWNREIPEEKPERMPTPQELSEALWNRYVAFQEAGFDKAQAFDLTKLEYEEMLEEIYRKPKR